MRFPQILSFLEGEGGVEMEDALGNKPGCVEKHLTLQTTYLASGFCRLRPQISTGALPLDSAGGLPSPDLLCPP